MQRLLLVISILLCTLTLYAQTTHMAGSNSQPSQLLEADLPVGFTDEPATLHPASENYFPGPSKYYLKKKLYKKTLDSMITALMAESGSIGLSIAVVSLNDVLYLKGYGAADLANNKPVTPQTLFHVGSISKLFTGIAIMQLVERKKIDLDKPLSTYIPEFTVKTHDPDAQPITVRSLMTHQSGLVGDIIKEWMTLSLPRPDFHRLLDYFKDEYTAYPPGYISSYSNAGVALLGVVIERVSGLEFRRYIKKNILNPCGMTFSNFSRSAYMEPYLAKSYSADSSEFPYWYIRDIAAGDLVTNGPEMARFMAMILHQGTFYQNRILKKSSLKTMFTPQNSSIPLDFPDDHGVSWGLSWILNNPTLEYAGTYVGHDGSLPFYSSSMSILPQQGIGVIVMGNSEAGESIVYKTADMALVKALQIFKGINPPEPEPVPPLTPLTDELINATCGSYATNDYGLLSFFMRNDTLHGRSPVIGTVQCIPHLDHWFSLYEHGSPIPEAAGIRLTVKHFGDEKIVGFESRGDNGSIYRMPQGVGYQLPELPNDAWDCRQGEYIITNPDPIMFVDRTFNLTQLPGYPLYLWQEGFVSVLDPLSDALALRVGRGRNVNQTIQVVYRDGEEQLYMLGYYLKKDLSLADKKTFAASASEQKSTRSFDKDRLIHEFRMHDSKLWRRK